MWILKADISEYEVILNVFTLELLQWKSKWNALSSCFI